MHTSTSGASHPMTLAPTSAAIVAAALLLLATAAPTAAQSSLPAGSPGRFTMYPADGGIIRLDTQTGALSTCKQAAGSWSCTIMPDDRTAISAELDRLKAENTELKSNLKRLEALAGLPPGAEPGSKPNPGALPTEEDIDKAMSYVQRMLKKFKEKLKELEQDDPARRTRF